MSGRKNVLQLYTDPNFTSADMSGSINGTPVCIQYLDNVGIQVAWAGATPGGTFTVQVSLDYDPQLPSATATWSTLQSPPGTNVSISPGGSAGNGYFDLNELSAGFVRLVYTTADESVGTATAKFTAKMI